MKDWKTTIHSEWFAEEAVETWYGYRRAAEEGSFGDDLGYDFHDATRHGPRTVAKIKGAVLESLGIADVDLSRLLELGEMIYRAIRPVDCASLVFRDALNRERWRLKRTASHRDRSAAFGRDMVPYRAALPSCRAAVLLRGQTAPPMTKRMRTRPGAHRRCRRCRGGSPCFLGGRLLSRASQPGGISSSTRRGPSGSASSGRFSKSGVSFHLRPSGLCINAPALRQCRLLSEGSIICSKASSPRQCLTSSVEQAAIAGDNDAPKPCKAAKEKERRIRGDDRKILKGSHQSQRIRWRSALGPGCHGRYRSQIHEHC